jgi:hypothetical protein
MRPILLLASAAVAASARGSTSRISRRGWNLPTAQKSVAAFVQRVSRGGDQAGDGYDDPYDDIGCSNSDDPYNDPYNQQYGNGDYYGDQQPHDYQDERYREDRYDDRGREGVAVRAICNIVIYCFGSGLVRLIFLLCFCYCRNLLFKYQMLLKRATDELV